MFIKTQRKLAILSLGLLYLVCTTGRVEAGDNLDALAITEPLYKFTSKLFSALNNGSSKGQSENIIVSPISMHKALNMVLLGTDAGSATERQLLDAIGYGPLNETEVLKCHEDYARLLVKIDQKTRTQERESSGYSKRLSSMIRADSGTPDPVNLPALDLLNMVITKNEARVLPEYMAKVQKYYDSKLENVDDKRPETKAKIMDRLNGWAREVGFNEPIVTRKELDKEFEAILLSAIRLQASWPGDFDETRRKEIEKGTRYLKLTNMARAQFKDPDAFERLSDLSAQITQLPMRGGLTYTMFEPLEYSTPGDNKLNKLVAQLFSSVESVNGAHSTKLVQVLRLLDSVSGHVEYMALSMPKFKFEKDYEITETLKSMGLERAFDAEHAEISRMTTKRVRMSQARHQAFFEVSKKGIKAAAVTKIDDMVTAPMPPKPLSVSIEKPFVFLVRYGEIPLFVGQLSSL